MCWLRARSHLLRYISSMHVTVAIMARCPSSQDVKTRLAGCLNSAQRAALYEAFLQDKLHTIRALPTVQGAIVYTPAERREWFATQAGPNTRLHAQGDGDLGARVIAAFDTLFDAGASAVVLTDSDSPNLPTERLLEAVSALRAGSELVLGPALDGGYYLVGLAHKRPALFDGVPWSTGAAFARTLRNARQLGMQPCILPPWYDIDEPDDLAALAADITRGRGGACPRTEAGLRSLGWLPQ